MKSKPAAQEPTVFLMKKLWHFSGNLRGRIVLYISMLVIANLVLLVAPIIFGALMEEIQAHGISSDNLSYIFILLFLLIMKEFVFWLFHGPARVIERLVAFHAAINYRRYLLQGVLDLGLNWHGEHDSGDTIDKINKAGEGLSEFGQNIFQIVQILVKLFGTSLALMWFSPWIGFSVFTFAILSLVVVFQFDRRLVPQYRGLNEYSNRASAGVFDSLSNITTVKILHIEKSVLAGVMSRFRASLPLYRENAQLNEWKWFTGMMCFQAIAVIPIGAYIYQGLKAGETLNAGVISTLYLYLSDLLFVFFNFGNIYEQIAIYKNRVHNAEPIEKAFRTRDRIGQKPAKDWQELTISNLSFRYDGVGDMPNLDHVTMRLRRGERVALIGESGSGKTTFLKVLHGMYPSATGFLQFNNDPAFKTCFADIDLRTMLVPQEPEIFSSTIRENITLGLDQRESQVMHAARIAAFEPVIAELPQGLDSVINEKGVNLSGGQKQRLALTRALLFSATKEIILLDESTSSVDPENELEIYHNIWNAFRSKTIIASIHKLNLLKLFDRIIMFEKSRIVDEGSFEDLLARNTYFRESWREFIKATAIR